MGKKKKGVIGYFMVFVLLSTVLVFLFAFAIPMLITIDTAFYEAGEEILDDAQVWVDRINNTAIKTQIQATLDDSKASIPDQIDVLGYFHQYSWIIVIIAVLFVIFMSTRQTVESEIR